MVRAQTEKYVNDEHQEREADETKQFQHRAVGEAIDVSDIGTIAALDDIAIAVVGAELQKDENTGREGQKDVDAEKQQNQTIVQILRKVAHEDLLSIVPLPRRNWCGWGESNPRLDLGKVI